MTVKGIFHLHSSCLFWPQAAAATISRCASAQHGFVRQAVYDALWRGAAGSRRHARRWHAFGSTWPAFPHLGSSRRHVCVFPYFLRYRSPLCLRSRAACRPLTVTTCIGGVHYAVPLTWNGSRGFRPFKP